MTNPVAMPEPYGYYKPKETSLEEYVLEQKVKEFDHKLKVNNRDLEEYWFKLQQTPMADDKDMVNSPSHYTQGEIECIDAIAQVVKDLDGMEAMCTGNAIKYLWRWKHKNGVEDLKKAQWYVQRMIDNYK